MVRLEDSTKPARVTERTSTNSSKISHRYAGLLSRLRAATNGNSTTPSVLGIISCQQSTASPAIAAQLAVSAATELFESTLVIDMSGSDSNMPRLLGTCSGPGVTEILAGEEDLRDCVVSGLYNSELSFVPQGYANGRPAIYANVRRFSELIEECRARYELVVVSLPPATESSPGAALAARLDGVLLVIDSESTEVTVARRAHLLLERSHARVLGAILSNSRDYLPAWLRSRV